MALNFNVTSIFEQNQNSSARIVINRGGTRSSKTYSILQLLILKALTEKNKRIIILRKSFPSLRRTVLKDFVDILNTYRIAQYFKINKTNNTYTSITTRSTIEFASCDDEQKIRGLSANYFWMNEANEIEEQFFTQTMLRLSNPSNDGKYNQYFIDLNPSSSKSWVKTVEDTRTDVDVIVSTYNDNPFLSPDAVKEIEDLRTRDRDLWLIYGEGQWGELRGQIFTNWETFNHRKPPDLSHLPVYYGLDWGYSNDWTALIKVVVDKPKQTLWVDERIFARGLTNLAINNKMEKSESPLSKDAIIIADSSEPKSIQELKNLGWRGIEGVKKGPGSVNNGIDILLRYKIMVAADATNIRDELTNYTWKTDKNGDVLNIPNDKHNHAIDAIRYVVMTYGDVRGSGKIYIR